MPHPSIPSIDFKAFRDGPVEQRKRIVLDVDEALRSAGFFELYNHGIEQDKINACFDWVCPSIETCLDNSKC